MRKGLHYIPYIILYIRLYIRLITLDMAQAANEVNNAVSNKRNNHRRCYVNKGVLKNSQISQENTCAGVFLKKAAGL